MSAELAIMLRALLCARYKAVVRVVTYPTKWNLVHTGECPQYSESVSFYSVLL